MLTFWALEKGLKYIQDSLCLHLRYSKIRLKHAVEEGQWMKGKRYEGTMKSPLSKGDFKSDALSAL
jgi:hypothetical protein